VRLRVLGSSSSVPRPARACSGYLLQSRNANIALEFGSGAFANLRCAIEYPLLDALVVSHMHADHFLDVIALRYALTYGPLRRAERLPLWLPPGGAAMLRRLCAAFKNEGSGDFLDGVFSVGEYDPSGRVEVGDVRLVFAPARHFVNAFAIRADCETSSVTYSGDTAPCEAVVELARGSELFLCEATLGLRTEGEARGHSSASEAGDMATRAGVRRLALTHYGTDCAPEALVEAAQGAFAGPVCVVDDGMEFDA
jgi:ribonuclease BN (tRNA processing enzyme)